MLKVGIIGLPNVGKSTLFNALLKKQVADVANYPFTTIDPNIGVIEVLDDRLEKLAKIIKTEKIVPAAIEFYDIAGLIKNAHKGEGLGNQFLSHIKEVDLIIHVVRLFEDENIAHTSEKIDPEQDISIINSELIFADLQTLSRQKQPKGILTKDKKTTYQTVQKIIKKLDQGVPTRDADLTDNEKQFLKKFNLLTFKKMLYVFNISEDQLENKQVTDDKINKVITSLRYTSHDSSYIFLCAKLESEIVALDSNEQKEYLQQYGLKESGLNRLIKTAYMGLDLISFFSGNQKEIHAWTLRRGETALSASGVVHTDFEKNFIKAEVVPYRTFIELGGWLKCREAGKSNIVGKDYLVKDGDVIDFKVNI